MAETVQDDNGSQGPIALVTGAGRDTGIGFAVCRALARSGMTVLLTARDAQIARDRADTLRAEGLDVEGHRLDLTDAQSITAVAETLADRFGRLDVLVNNAAATATQGQTVAQADLDAARAAIEVTLLGTWRTTQVLLPLLRKSQRPRIVNVSSGAGSHGDPGFGLASGNPMGPGYAVAKAALNAWTSALAYELRDTNILVNAVCPGFTATFPGGEQMGARPVQDGAASVVWAAHLPDDGPRGGLFRDGEPLPW